MHELFVRIEIKNQVKEAKKIPLSCNFKYLKSPRFTKNSKTLSDEGNQPLSLAQTMNFLLFISEIW